MRMALQQYDTCSLLRLGFCELKRPSTILQRLINLLVNLSKREERREHELTSGSRVLLHAYIDALRWR